MSRMRGVPEVLRKVLEQLPKTSNCMDVMRTISSVLGILEPESTFLFNIATNNDQYTIALRLISVFGPALNYWYHFSHNGKKI